jgi:hypothetical protein
MGRRATELTEGFPSDASRAARVIKVPVVFYMGKGRYRHENIQKTPGS